MRTVVDGRGRIDNRGYRLAKGTQVGFIVGVMRVVKRQNTPEIGVTGEKIGGKFVSPPG
jgi:hypothetical protein